MPQECWLFSNPVGLQVESAEWSIFFWQKDASAGAARFSDDPDARPIGQPIRGQDSKSLLHAQLVFANVVGVQITWVETDVLNEKNQRVIAAGFECSCPNHYSRSVRS